jgi:hypothetical protein
MSGKRSYTAGAAQLTRPAIPPERSSRWRWLLTGGVTLTGAATGEGFTTAWIDFDDPTWPQARFTARYMMIYDASDANKSYAIIDFGTDKTGQGGNFTAQLPEPDALNAIIRI